jgi:hypothetical protein
MSANRKTRETYRDSVYAERRWRKSRAKQKARQRRRRKGSMTPDVVVKQQQKESTT